MRAGRKGPLQRILVKSRRVLPGGFVFLWVKDSLVVVTMPDFKFFAVSARVCAIILHSMVIKIKLYL